MRDKRDWLLVALLAALILMTVAFLRCKDAYAGEYHVFCSVSDTCRLTHCELFSHVIGTEVEMRWCRADDRLIFQWREPQRQTEWSDVEMYGPETCFRREAYTTEQWEATEHCDELVG